MLFNLVLVLFGEFPLQLLRLHLQPVLLVFVEFLELLDLELVLSLELVSAVKRFKLLDLGLILLGEFYEFLLELLFEGSLLFFKLLGHSFEFGFGLPSFLLHLLLQLLFELLRQSLPLFELTLELLLSLFEPSGMMSSLLIQFLGELSSDLLHLGLESFQLSLPFILELFKGLSRFL